MAATRPNSGVSAVSLDHPESFGPLDSHDMLGMAERFPDQCRAGLALGDQLSLPDAYRIEYDGIVGLGMGGSGIGSDLLAAICGAELRMPAVTVRDYSLPAWVGRRTLVFAVSYSGDTEETLAAFGEARDRGAKVIAVTSGGELARICEDAGLPCVIVPGGQPPRASTGYLLMPAIAILERLGLIGDQTAARRECLEILDAQAAEYGRSSPAGANRAKEIAGLLHGKVPVIYAAAPGFGSVAYRWRTQCNENAKVLALSHELPELDHNEVVGWELGRSLLGRPCVIVLTDPALSERMQLRLRITRDLFGPEVEVHFEAARGGSMLARVLSVMYLGDAASVYLAFLNGVDPYGIRAIDELKERLAAKD
jgi:glucose/mannose-6-phosphate isomerase